MGFKIGDQVVCVEKNPMARKNSSYGVAINYNQEYTISGIPNNPLSFVEVVCVDGVEGHWAAESFVKIQPSKKKSNSVTKALVEKFKESERELVEYAPEEILIANL